MAYKIRKIEINSYKEALEEFSKIGATLAGQKIMSKKLFPIALKVKDLDVKAANILKQEMLARGGDVVTSRNTLISSTGLTDVIILGSINSLKSLAEKIRYQPFGLKNLSLLLKDYIKSIEDNKLKEKKILIISNKKFDIEKEGAIIMGVLNVTPDSFYDGGLYYDYESAKKRAEQIVNEGAHIIDVGGLSTRPGSEPVDVNQELLRVKDILSFIKKNFDILISIDTYRAEVAEYAINTGADIVNDISGLTFDENMLEVIKRKDVSVIIMHIKGTPQTMQKNPQYNDLIDEIYDYLYTQSEKAILAGVKKEKIIVDPGIGFGKNLDHNLKILSKIKDFCNMGYPVLIGASRKSFIGTLLGGVSPAERLFGSISAAVVSYINGASLLRVHDVKQTKEAIKIAQSIKNLSE